MATLYTYGDFFALTPTEFNSYSLIRYSAAQLGLSVYVGFSASGAVDFSIKLGAIAAEIDGWTGADKITSGSGADSLWGNSGNDSLYGGSGDDLIVGDWDDGVASGIDWMYGGDGNDQLIGGLNVDTFYGGNGDDLFTIGDATPGNDGFFGGTGVDSVSVRDVFNNGVSTVAFNRLVLNAAAGVEFFAQDDREMRLTGTAGNDLIDLSGVTALTWNGANYDEKIAFDLGTGNDTFTSGAGQDTVQLSSGFDHVNLGARDDVLTLTDGVLTGDVLFGGTGNDTLILGDMAYAGTTVQRVNAVTSFSFVTAGQFESLLVGSNVQFTGTAAADVFNLTAFGIGNILLRQPLLLLGGHDRFTAGSTGMVVDGGDGNDSLTGGAGDDTLLGGAGNDLMVGGGGSDTYQIDSAGDVVVETGTYGIDTLMVSAHTWTLVAPFEGLMATGTAGLIGIGNDLNNYLTGGVGNDSLRGLGGSDRLTGAGKDTLVGGLGSDTYVVSDTSVTIVEIANQGIDTVVAETTNWALSGSLENLTMTGASNAVGVGTLTRNVMTASGTGHKTLQALGGDDLLIALQANANLQGGRGNDTYSIRILGAQIVELDGGGIDSADIYFGLGDGPLPFPLVLTYVLADFVENMSLYSQPPYFGATPYGVTGTGNASNNLILGDKGSDTLYGLDGNDTLNGGSGELGATGNDGRDSLIGGNGDDTYRLKFYSSTFGGDVSDTVVELQDGGFDTIELSKSFVDLNLYSNVEGLNNSYYSGSGVVKLGSTARGNELDNRLVTGIGDDRLDGGNGHDTLTGGEGKDQFIFGSRPGTGPNFDAESSDVITDFTRGSDKLALNFWSFQALGNGGIFASAFKVISGGGVVDTSDRLLYDQTTGQLFYDRDGNGTAERWQIAVLSNQAQLSVTDFILTF